MPAQKSIRYNVNLFGMIRHETILFFLFTVNIVLQEEECALMRVVNIFKVVVREMGQKRKTVTEKKQ